MSLAKITKILKSNSIETEQDPILSFITKGPLFSAKTDYVVTSRKFYVVEEKSKTVAEKNILSEGESFVVLTKSFELLTDRRLIYLEIDNDHNPNISKEISYLDPEEKFVSFVLGDGDFGQHNGNFGEEKAKELALEVKFNIITDKALKVFGKAPELRLLDVLEWSSIKSIGLLQGASMISECSTIAIELKDGKSRSITNRNYTDPARIEDFPRKICQAANLPFAIPFENHSVKDKLFIEFYPKSDLKWPLKCSNCLSETPELKFKRLKVENDSNPHNTAPHKLVGPRSVELDIPYCETCHNTLFLKSVSNPGFNGVTVLLEFKNEQYAREFIHVNS